MEVIARKFIGADVAKAEAQAAALVGGERGAVLVFATGGVADALAH